MKDYSERNYQDFFKEELYDRFVQYLLDEYGAKTIITILGDNQLVTKKGFNLRVIEQFNEFLELNPAVAKVFLQNRMKCYSLRNVAGGPLAFPIDGEDDMLMITQGLRPPEIIPVQPATRATKEMKRSAGPMRGQTLKGDGNERKYITLKRLTVHFKEGYATKIGKTTLSFMVDSRSEAMYIVLDRFEKRVAYATIQGEEEFCFVKPRNGKKKRTRKLRGSLQQ